LIGKDISSDRSGTILCHFGQYEKELIPGMYMNADLEITTESAFVIPDDGLVRFEGKQYVYTKSEDDKFEMHEVVVSNTANGFTQISFTDGGDMAGRTFVLSGAYTLLMAMKNTEE
jgi:cobalt-zinc-cadmium efflux system membrane fusion protein